VTRASEGEPLAETVWNEAVDALADGLVTCQGLYDVSVLVLGGGLAEAGDALLRPVRDAFQKKITFHRMPEIVRAELGDLAGCLGSALLALDHLNAHRRRPAP
jgi:glucokinase